ncbi:hypothetical protein [Sabulicella glaciei]|uniref:Antitoxin Xre/MbcA/ParS-like toxin-binding domain-containing protein n=1 Tax=Sabulicella glaciei TaxID=2984948 RepID=A0ABT3P213_9PROT|nr:hypothetical protein [Roseococcus sp. MDT2-1-1]MCW8088445.1 hypothetical protein [Roseococcus sp. MDT2-1-1]
MTTLTRHRSVDDPRSSGYIRHTRMRRAEAVVALIEEKEAELVGLRRDLFVFDSEDKALSQLLMRVVEVFGEHAPRWWLTPIHDAGGRTPRAMALGGEVERVWRLIGRR